MINLKQGPRLFQVRSEPGAAPRLENLGIVTELTSRRRGRVFSYRRYVDELGSELKPA
jgi:hypothetical protein